MRELASVELYLLVGELQQVKGMYIKKFYDLGNGSFKLALSGKDGSFLLYCKLVKTINLTSFTETAGEATNFAMAMRKRIEGSKIASIGQVGSDRILAIGIEGDEGYKIIIEMYGKGNLLLIDKTNTIVLAYRVMDQKNRTVRVRQVYEFSKTEPFDFDDEAQLDRALAHTQKIDNRLISTLSGAMNLGPLYIEEIITSSGLSPNAKSLTEKERHELKKGAARFCSKLKNEKPRIYVDAEGRYADYAVVGIGKYRKYKAMEFDNISAMLDRFYLGERTESKETDKKAEELRSSLEQQRGLAKRFEAESGLYFEDGTMILNNMAEINEVIDYLKTNKRATLEELRKKFPNIKLDNLDLKDKTLEIEI